jgi:hypothetical protein
MMQVGLGVWGRGVLRAMLAVGLIGGAAAAAHADDATNVDLSAYYNGYWCGPGNCALNGAAVAAALMTDNGNAGSGLSFSDPNGQVICLGSYQNTQCPSSLTISSLSIALGPEPIVNTLINTFFGGTGDQADIIFTNSNNQTATFSLIGDQTIRDYNNDGYTDTLSGANSDTQDDGDVTAQLWWSTQDAGNNNNGDDNDNGQSSQRLDAQTFYLPSSWYGSDLVSMQISVPLDSNGDVAFSAMQVDVVPEPSSLALFATGLAGLRALRCRRATERTSGDS